MSDEVTKSDWVQGRYKHLKTSCEIVANLF